MPQNSLREHKKQQQQSALCSLGVCSFLGSIRDVKMSDERDVTKANALHWSIHQKYQFESPTTLLSHKAPYPFFISRSDHARSTDFTSFCVFPTAQQQIIVCSRQARNLDKLNAQCCFLYSLYEQKVISGEKVASPAGELVMLERNCSLFHGLGEVQGPLKNRTWSKFIALLHEVSHNHIVVSRRSTSFILILLGES